MMSLRTARSLVFSLFILIAIGCGQESDLDERAVTVTPGDVMDQPPYPGAVVINEALTPLDQWGSDEYEIRTGGDQTPVVENDTFDRHDVIWRGV